ncbi:alpha/beta fold hydrolase BchO [Rhodobacter capsulatus]|uniref:alpha/beta fold hydrolase BchO n=1 Tax=Rhodobacter capsulatus TaxID=1061 RepID=UPI004029C269
MDPRALPANWPYRSAAARHRVGPIDWWVIDTGPADGPVLLLLHGLGASGHSFRRMIPGLSARYRVIVPDLPGHGCSRSTARNRFGLKPMAEDIWKLCQHLGVMPAAVIGHSAGGAIALQLALDTPVPRVVGINAALDHFEGVAGVIFPMMARGLAALPFTAPLVTRFGASRQRISQLLDMTGSVIDAAGKAQYTALIQTPEHVDGGLRMMAQWELGPLIGALPRIAKPVFLIAGTGDRAVPAHVSADAARFLPMATLRRIDGGHLIHEVAADGLSEMILDWLEG